MTAAMDSVVSKTTLALITAISLAFICGLAYVQWRDDPCLTAGSFKQPPPLQLQPGPPFIVHYVLMHPSSTQAPGNESALSFLDCMSMLSVVKNLKPDAIYLHTNVPEFWPFTPCEEFIKTWGNVKVINAPRKLTVNGSRINFIEHEADIIKLEALIEYGGLALDFDVYVIDGDRLRHLLLAYPCLGCHENVPKVNAGFLACQRGAEYPRMILKEYGTNYRPDLWVYNSGIVPWKLLRKNPELAHLVEGVCNAPEPNRKEEFVLQDGRHPWAEKVAHHSFLHDRNYTEQTVLTTSDSSMARLLYWILYTVPEPRKKTGGHQRDLLHQ
ncbi:hypothetical protein BV898_08684 [Hypsibius exemplaris]|uniref:Uncharacterized protein n=1 Tax=Hypsibius exemplaris TaxID=2072580 RepID=A0A1W0WQ02_HYPEX|nr:hypothetical protein BV898_08684 [Hypsibius exemplaris]